MGLDIYSSEETGQQNFVIAINGPAVNLKPVVTAFTTLNRDQFRQANLSIRQSQVADYKLMVVSSFKNKK